MPSTPWNLTPALLLTCWAAQDKGTACLNPNAPTWQVGHGHRQELTGAGSRRPSPKTPKHFRTVTWAFQSAAAICLGDYCLGENPENPGALNVPSGHLAKAPYPSQRTTALLQSGFCGGDDSPAPPPRSRDTVQAGFSL